MSRLECHCSDECGNLGIRKQIFKTRGILKKTPGKFFEQLVLLLAFFLLSNCSADDNWPRTDTITRVFYRITGIKMEAVDYCIKEKREQIIGADTISCGLAFTISCETRVDSTETFTINFPCHNCDLKPTSVCLDYPDYSSLYFDGPIFYKNKKMPAGSDFLRKTDPWAAIPKRGKPAWIYLGKEYKIPNGTYKVRYECRDYHNVLFSDSLQIVVNRK
jgi:hypothetical protein